MSLIKPFCLLPGGIWKSREVSIDASNHTPAEQMTIWPTSSFFTAILPFCRDFIFQQRHGIVCDLNGFRLAGPNLKSTSIDQSIQQDRLVRVFNFAAMQRLESHHSSSRDKGQPFLVRISLSQSNIESKDFWSRCLYSHSGFGCVYTSRFQSSNRRTNGPCSWS